jgi:hypothetical protein
MTRFKIWKICIIKFFHLYLIRIFSDLFKIIKRRKLINLLKNESERTYEKLEKKIDQTTEKLDIIMQMLNSK